ncbi:MAG: GDYXXLXY domain-containing protein, partial [Erythrobacter sp.]
MIRAARLLAAAIPLAGLAALLGLSDHTYHQGTEWEVPIMGYDPRDYLRGHYVEFTYAWPGLQRPEFGMWPDALCLAGQAPRLDRVAELKAGQACAHPLRTDGSGVYGSSALMNGRLYIGQDRAAELEEQLRNRDQRGLVTVRQREDGSFTPISIRFRPLTPQEIAERDAP